MAARHAAKGRSNAKADASEGRARHAGHLAQNAPCEKSGRHPRSAHHARTVAVAAAIAAVVAAGAVMASPQLRGQIFSPTGGADNNAGASAASSRRDDASASGEKAGTTKDGGSDASASDASTSDASTSDASASSEAKPAPQEDTTALDTGAGAKVTAFATSGGISVTAPAGFESTPTCRHLQDAVAAFTAKGYHLGFAMVDLKTGRGASYNASQKFYPASSIKAVYVTAILESTHGGAASSSDAITKCLVDSDNDAFRTLLKTYGYNVYGSWLQSRAPEAAQEAYGYNYPHISAAGMLNCWREVYRFGKSGEPGASLLTGCLARTNHSAWGALLRDRFTVWSKPGWYPTNEGLASTATADNGIVFSDCGDYAVAVLSDAPSDFDSLLPVLDALNAAHGKMCGGSSALRQTSATTVG
ncbi:MAG: serine hydrolase [Parafannyhessea umbonata]|uniref:serine hydrolase n=2 Tax=Parafannyhessea umbonata TaxID=604330 RepID=UPI0026EE9ADA|nr:serine hydrolase [Parafannyhessea umbonata]MDD6360171.1 serine hydrolase [Parafannyhessea umbonata]MDD6566719.1 serine hydrolase [Parafannyhessea umbonata]